MVANVLDNNLYPCSFNGSSLFPLAIGTQKVMVPPSIILRNTTPEVPGILSRTHHYSRKPITCSGLFYFKFSSISQLPYLQIIP
jgi:hypothetical protein